jgi:glucosylceramidase
VLVDPAKTFQTIVGIGGALTDAAAVPSRDGLLTTAFLNTDGSLAVIVMNPGDAEVRYSLWIRGKGASTASPPHSIETFVLR